MTTEIYILILLLIGTLIVAGVLIYYFFNIDKKKHNKESETYTREQSVRPIIIESKDKLLERDVNLESQSKETSIKQNNMTNNISLLSQKIDNLEKSQKNIIDMFLQIKTSMSDMSKISGTKSPVSSNTNVEKSYAELDKLIPYLKTIIDSDIPIKLKNLEDMFKSIKDSLATTSSVKTDKVDLRGIEDLKIKINEIITLLKVISSS